MKPYVREDGDDERRALGSEAAELHARVFRLQHERDDALERLRVLAALQRRIVNISLAETPAEIVTELLRGVYDPLGFSRAIYFGVDRENGIEASVQIDGSETVEPSDAMPNLEPDSPLLAVLRGAAAPLRGDSQGAPPVRDVRGAYVLAPLTYGRPLGIVYADEPRATPGRRADPGLLGELAAVAAAAIANRTRLARATELATLDSLTGLLNRRALAERLALELEGCRRQGRSLTYVMIDVDDLKGINDSRGHARGDETLKDVASVLLRNSRAGDVVGRFGGDEFVVMLVDVERELASSLVARLSSGLRENGLSCSLGAAVFSGDTGGKGLDRLADDALYAAKAAGKNRYAFA